MDVTVLAENENALCIRIEGREKIGESYFKTLRHEIWTDKEKYKEGISLEETDEGTLIYRRGFAGSTDEEAIEVFNKMMG